MGDGPARLQRLAGMDLLVDSVVLLALPVSLSLMQGSRRDAAIEFMARPSSLDNEGVVRLFEHSPRTLLSVVL